MNVFDVPLSVRMRREGYRPTLVHYIDKEVIDETTCDECAGDCYARAFRDDDGDYRVFSICSICGDEVEI